MNENLSSTPSTDEQPGPSVPAAYRIYEEDAPEFEEGVSAAFWTTVGVLAGLLVLFLSLATGIDRIPVEPGRLYPDDMK